MKQRLAIAAAVAAIGLAAVGLWWSAGGSQSQSPDGHPSGRAARPVPQSSADSENAAMGLGPVPATLSVHYAFRMVGGSFPKQLESELAATLDLGALRQDGTERWLPVRLAGPQLQMNQAAQSVFDVPADRAELAAPWAVRVDGGGRVVEVRFAAGTSTTTQGVLASLAQAVQLVGPAHAGERTWQTDERDANGPYQATYTREGDGSVTKRWTQTQAGFSATSQAHYALRDGHIDTVHWEQQGTAVTSSLVAGRETRFSVVIDLHYRGKNAGDWAVGLDPKTLRPYDLGQLALRRRAAEPPRALQVVLDEVVALASGTDTAGRMKLRADLTRAIAANPAAAKAVGQTLRKGSLTGRARTVAIASLVGARTAEAQREVAELAADRSLAEDLRLSLLQSASLMSSPTPEFVAMLAQLAYATDDPGYSAAAATTLGASLAFLHEHHPQEAKQALQGYVEHAKQNVQPEPSAASAALPPVGIRIAWLAGLGNTADPAALPVILAGLHDSNELVRGSAALALRFQAPTACIEAMQQQMATDRSIHVRENILEAAQTMGPDVTASLVQKALFYDSSEFVRKAAAYVLATWSHEAPGLRAVLVDALKVEKSPRVAEALKNFVEPGRIPGSPAAAPHLPEAKP
ncbi:MAG: HEAT repeat domain-containing protein [Deltaproteobacteria bacterium]|nr:HEAT repeat domain-containing protein [Deltaproteobacteria bacterium]